MLALSPAAFAAGGDISGTVTDAVTLAGIQSAAVNLYDSADRLVTSTITAADGIYVFSAVPAGTYKVGFSGGNYLPQFYNGRPSPADADPVAVADGSITGGINAALVPLGQITGTVTDSMTHAAVQDVRVTLYDPMEKAVTTTTTAADGAYVFGGVAPGTYEVGFSGSHYLEQFYKGRSSVAIADPVVVLAGSTTAPIDAALTPTPGQIIGTVTDAMTRGAVSGASVNVYDSNGQLVKTVSADAAGVYTVPGLPPGTYRVEFAGHAYIPQFYSGRPSHATADPVIVAADFTTAGIDAALTPSPGRITGTVTDAITHGAVAGASVSVYGSGGQLDKTVATDAAGVYTVPDLPPGTYRVGFAGHAHIQQFYKGKPSLATADPVVVAADSTTAGIDAALTPSPGRITGTVTDAATKRGVQAATAYVYDASGNLASSALTAANGAYTVSGLPPGSYRVGFVADAYLPQFYDGKASLAAADRVAVAADSTTAGVDAALVTSTGQISGRVTDAPTTDPIRNIAVTVYDMAGANLGSACTAADGTYTIAGLAPGSYRVGFNDDCGATGHVPQFFNDKSSLASADRVTVIAGSKTTGIDAAMQPIRPAPRPPSNTVTPTVRGNATLGVTLSAATGEWSGTAPISYAYQWQRCSPSCVNLPGAAEASYTLLSTDLGAKVRVVVGAANAAGFALSASAQIGPVAASAAQIKTLLSSDIVPRGKDAAIQTLLRKGSYAYQSWAMGAGRLAISWYQVPSGARLAKAKPQPVLVASGQTTFKRFGAARVTVRLTRKGRQVLQQARKQLKLTATASFTPAARPAVRAQRAFTLSPTPTSPPVPAVQLGASVNRLFNDRVYTEAQIGSHLQALRNTGATIARSDSLWEWSEPDRPIGGLHRYDWRFDDLIAGSLAAHGLRWLPIIDYAPAWAATSSGQLHSPPRSPNEYAYYAAALAARYGPGGAFWRAHPRLRAKPVDAYEIWNEPDNPFFWPFAPSASRYATLYQSARRAIKAVDPTARTIVGGIVRPESFLPAMLVASPSLRTSTDGVAIHPYGVNPLAVLEKAHNARGALAALGMSTVPLYVTEFGWSAQAAGAPGSLPRTLRPGYITQTLSNLAHLDCGIAAALIYTWVTPERSPANREDWYGIHPPSGKNSPDTQAFSTGLRNATRPASPIRLCAGT